MGRKEGGEVDVGGSPPTSGESGANPTILSVHPTSLKRTRTDIPESCMTDYFNATKLLS